MNNNFYYSATLAELINDNSEPPNPIIDNGILLDGTILIIVGPAKSKKTFLTQNLGLSIAMGNDFAGFKITKPKKVLYYLAEGGYFPNRERLRKMAENISPDNNYEASIPDPLPGQEYKFDISVIFGQEQYQYESESISTTASTDFPALQKSDWLPIDAQTIEEIIIKIHNIVFFIMNIYILITHYASI